MKVKEESEKVGLKLNIQKSKIQTVVQEKTLGSPLDSKEIKPVNSKGNQHWIFTGRTEAEAPIFWPPDVKSQLTETNSDAGKHWQQEEKGDGRGQDGRMASPTQWTWVWTNWETVKDKEA